MIYLHTPYPVIISWGWSTSGCGSPKTLLPGVENLDKNPMSLELPHTKTTQTCQGQTGCFFVGGSRKAVVSWLVNVWQINRCIERNTYEVASLNKKTTWIVSDESLKLHVSQRNVDLKTWDTNKWKKKHEQLNHWTLALYNLYMLSFRCSSHTFPSWCLLLGIVVYKSHEVFESHEEFKDEMIYPHLSD